MEMDRVPAGGLAVSNSLWANHHGMVELAAAAAHDLPQQRFQSGSYDQGALVRKGVVRQRPATLISA